MRAGVVQMTAGDDPAANLTTLRDALEQAAQAGAQMVFTPEVCNCVSASRPHQTAVLHPQDTDPTLAALRAQARTLGVWVSIGSLALKTTTGDAPFCNRSFLIDPQGQIVANYDKIHMFDVTLSETERYRESAAYRPGKRAVLGATPWGDVGLTVCYDLRFPALARRLAQAGAAILTVPAAFAVPTGRAHWHVLLRARAIETGCFVIAAAQTGTHPASQGKSRQTYGHGLIVAPWGEVLLDMGQAPGVAVIDLDLTEVHKARARIPALEHDAPFELTR